jgi:hypothetical protein
MDQKGNQIKRKKCGHDDWCNCLTKYPIPEYDPYTGEKNPLLESTTTPIKDMSHQIVREFIYGVCDKTGNCNSYFGFFKNIEDAEHEVGVQSNRLKEDFGMTHIDIQKDRSLVNGELAIVIHSYVLR